MRVEKANKKACIYIKDEVEFRIRFALTFTILAFQ